MFSLQGFWLRDYLQQKQRNLDEANYWREYFPAE